MADVMAFEIPTSLEMVRIATGRADIQCNDPAWLEEAIRADSWADIFEEVASSARKEEGSKFHMGP